MKSVKDKAYKEALDDFRQKHFKELTTNLKVLKAVRDSNESADKDRISASKEISMMLAARTQDKRPPVNKPTEAKEANKLSTEESKDLEELLSNA